MTAYDRDPNPGLVYVSDRANWGTSRHQIGEVELTDRGRKVDFRGSRRVYPHKPDVAGAGLETRHDHGRSWMSNQHEFNPQTRRERARDLNQKHSRSNPPQFSGRWILGVLRKVQPDPEFASLYQIDDARVARLLCMGRHYQPERSYNQKKIPKALCHCGSR
jgi:hypothetical protein